MFRLKLILLLGLVFVFTGCSKEGHFLGRDDVSAASVLAPLDGILASVAQDPNILYASPNTKQTIDIIFKEDDKPFEGYNNNSVDILTMQQTLAKLAPSNTNPVYRYFRYAEGVSIPAYKLLEGTNITIDKTYKGESNKPLKTNIARSNSQDDDTSSPTGLMPVFGRVLNPNLKRWSSSPELFTLRKDYLAPNATTEKEDWEQEKKYLSSYSYSEPEKLVLAPTNKNEKRPPALIFVLYKPSNYWQTDNRSSREQENELYYFDVYYSIDQWNIFVNKQSGTVERGNHPDKLRLPNEFGICNYNDTSTSSKTSIVIPKMPLSYPQDAPDCHPSPTLHRECSLFAVNGHCCPSSGDCPQETPISPNPTVDGDLEFTLITMLTNNSYRELAQQDQETYKYSQPDVNLWVKYEFIEMLQNEDATFEVISDKLKPLNEKNGFSPKNNLQVPLWLYSEEAVIANMATCKSAEEPQKCVLDHARYKVQYTPTETFYHNRVLIDKEGKIYERATSGAREGARKAGAIPDWFWCWFMPE